jgi:hypothetical protein
VVVIVLVVLNRYHRQQVIDTRLCTQVQMEWQQIQRLAVKAGLALPARPPQCR